MRCRSIYLTNCGIVGAELYKGVYALALISALINGADVSNLRQMDAMSEDAAEFIRDSNITKVLMNPPYERKYGCMKIVTNVLDNVPTGTKAAFILPVTLKSCNYKNAATNTKVLNTKIKLPVDKNGEIDYNKIKRVVSEFLDIAEHRLIKLKEILNGTL